MTALQNFIGCNGDGEHGSFTNMFMMPFLRQYLAPEHRPTSRLGSDLLIAFWHFLSAYGPIAATRDLPKPPAGQEDPRQVTCGGNCTCLCATILRAASKDLPPADDQKDTEAVQPCPLTQTLQDLLNAVQDPHDLTSALEAVRAAQQ